MLWNPATSFRRSLGLLAVMCRVSPWEIKHRWFAFRVFLFFSLPPSLPLPSLLSLLPFLLPFLPLLFFLLILLQFLCSDFNFCSPHRHTQKCAFVLSVSEGCGFFIWRVIFRPVFSTGVVFSSWDPLQMALLSLFPPAFYFPSIPLVFSKMTGSFLHLSTFLSAPYH